jgi:hypothetical protein
MIKANFDFHCKTVTNEIVSKYLYFWKLKRFDTIQQI